MERGNRPRGYKVILAVIYGSLTFGCAIYHYDPVDPKPTKEALPISIDCGARYLNTITAIRNADGSGYAYSYTCSDYPPKDVQLIIKEQ